MSLREKIGASSAAALTAAVMVILCVPVVAQSAKPVIEANPFLIGVGETDRDYVRCPGRKRITGGGALQISGQTGAQFGTVIEQSFPSGSDGGPLGNGFVAKMWQASVRASNNTTSTEAKVLAVCSGSSDATAAWSGLTPTPNGIAEASAKCPAGKRVVGGGFRHSGSQYTSLMASGPLDETGNPRKTRNGDRAKSWYVAMHSDESSPAPFPAVYALCSAKSKATVRTTRIHLEDGETRSGLARCPAGQFAVGGGIVQLGKADSAFLIRGSGPTDASGSAKKTNDGDRPRAWRATEYNLFFEEERDMKVIALCE